MTFPPNTPRPPTVLLPAAHGLFFPWEEDLLGPRFALGMKQVVDTKGSGQLW